VHPLSGTAALVSREQPPQLIIHQQGYYQIRPDSKLMEKIQVALGQIGSPDIYNPLDISVFIGLTAVDKISIFT